jgi:hypothetical protein
MIRRPPHRRLPLFAITLAATVAACCGEAGPTDPGHALDLPEDQPLATVMPDLEPEAGTAGTERYVPTLQRVLHRAVGVMREKRGEEAAAAVVAEAQRLQADIRAAKEAGDKAAYKEAAGKLEVFAARVGLRVFGVPLARHVAGSATRTLQDLMPRLRAAAEAGQDVSRLVNGAQGARTSLAAAKEAWENEKPVRALVLAASALDTATKIGALLASS